MMLSFFIVIDEKLTRLLYTTEKKSNKNFLLIDRLVLWKQNTGIKRLHLSFNQAYLSIDTLERQDDMMVLLINFLFIHFKFDLKGSVVFYL
jgi:hypothetical protein